MGKYKFKTYEEFLFLYRKKSAQWYEANKEYKKAYVKARNKGQKITREQYEADKLKESEK